MQYDTLIRLCGIIDFRSLLHIESAVSFLQAFVASRKPVTVLCHGSSKLAKAAVLRGSHITSLVWVRTNGQNAGARGQAHRPSIWKSYQPQEAWQCARIHLDSSGDNIGGQTEIGNNGLCW
jgi:putative intracellular protease/amidase